MVHINETKPTSFADGLLEVQWGRSRFQNAIATNVIIAFSDTATLYVHSGNNKSHLAPDDERYSCSSAPFRSVRHDLVWNLSPISF
jgi:hypothetical protein